MRKASKEFLRDLKLVNPGLFVVWNDLLQRYQILYRDTRFGERMTPKIVYTVENQDGSFRELDRRTILWLSVNVAWDVLGQYPEPQDMYHYLKEKRAKEKLKKDEKSKDYRRWINKEYRTFWKAALANAQRGVIHSPEQKERKIIVPM